MKKYIRTSLLLFVFVISFTASGHAQQYVSINSAAILIDMPEVKQMKSNLERFHSQLQKKGQELLQAYQQKEKNALEKKERGELSPFDEQRLIEELQKDQDEILKYEKEMQTNLLEKEQELLSPILEKVNNAINEVARERAYLMIFDISSGAMLFVEEALDVTPLVKAKLGIQ